jgi:cytochrome c2
MRIERCPAAACFLLASLLVGCDGDSTGPGLTAYERASVVRGGISYDKYWSAGTGFDTSDPLVATFNAKGDFFRCKQCHGWDQLGSTGFYVNRGPSASRPRVSSVDLVAFTETRTPQQLFDAIKTGSGAARRSPTYDLSTYDPLVTPSIGDQMPDYGAFMSDAQIWDLVRFLKEDALVATDLYDMTVAGTYPTGTFTSENLGRDGVAASGEAIFTSQCAFCHGTDGKALTLEGVSLGVFLRSKPAEVQHKVRYGQLGSIMRGTRLTLAEMKHLYKYLSDSTVMPR